MAWRKKRLHLSKSVAGTSSGNISSGSAFYGWGGLLAHSLSNPWQPEIPEILRYELIIETAIKPFLVK
jgi:hypothetical protein